MHPRTETRRDFKELLTAALPGVPVYASLVRKLRSNEKEAVLVYTLEEDIKRPSSPSRRAGQPYSRAMTVGVVVSVLASGDGEEASDRADEIARIIELAVNAIPEGPELTSCRVAAEEGQQVRCTVDLIYKLTKTDQMGA